MKEKTTKVCSKDLYLYIHEHKIMKKNYFDISLTGVRIVHFLKLFSTLS